MVPINTHTPSLVSATIAKKMESRDKLRNPCYRYNLSNQNKIKNLTLETVWNGMWKRQHSQNFNRAVGGTEMSLDFSVPQMAEKKNGSDIAGINGSA